MNTPSSNGTHHSPTRPPVGVLEWFRPGEHERVERAADALATLGIRHLRTGVSWADFHTPEGAEWYAWLLPALAARFDVLPCFSYTPPSIGERPQTSAPPKNLDDYAAFVALMCDRHGESFEWAELWNEPNNQREWDATLDAGHEKFARMVRAAAGGARAKGKKVLLGGLSPIDPNFFSMLHERGALACFDAVGVHGFPHSFEFHWPGWADLITGVRQRLDWCGSGAEIWITEAGYSTWRHDEWEQLATFADAVNAPAARVYWYALYDLHPTLPTVDGFHSDEREYAFGLLRTDGGEKLLARVWRDRGIEGVMQFARLTEPDVRRRGGIDSGAGVPPAKRKEKPQKPVLITGGAGFVGTNLADRLARDGRRVHLFDNLSRPGVEDNLRRLKKAHGDRVHFECADVRNEHALRGAVANASAVFHFAAQVAVTTSLTSPAHDFEVNARGTLNLLEALRPMGKNAPPLLFTSTNKVYGDLGDLHLRLHRGRYEPRDDASRANGVGENRPLDFHSPYGCSKGAADQYVLDYARTFGLPACVFRMSCIYGPHQCGNEDQGWVAHFARQALAGEPVTLYGDGRQVRDVLFAADLIDAMLTAERRMPDLAGRAFNLGGGPGNAISLLELLDLIRDHTGRKVDVDFGPWRPGDQRYYVSDTTRFTDATGWRATTGVAQGVGRLIDWLGTANAELPEQARV